MNQYIITLPDDKAATYRQVTLILFLVNLVVLLFIYFNSPDSHVRYISFAGAIIALVSLLFFLVNRLTKKVPPYRVEISFFLLGVLWFFLEKYLLGLSILSFATIGMYSRRKLEIIFSKNHIIYPSFPKKKFLWHDISNVILKDSMLTIDLKNNKLLQAVVAQKSAQDINEREFNVFCKDCLNKPPQALQHEPQSKMG